MKLDLLTFLFLGIYKTHATHLQIGKHSVHYGHWTLQERRRVRGSFSGYIFLIVTNWETSLPPALLPPPQPVCNATSTLFNSRNFRHRTNYDSCGPCSVYCYHYLVSECCHRMYASFPHYELVSLRAKLTRKQFQDILIQTELCCSLITICLPMLRPLVHQVLGSSCLGSVSSSDIHSWRTQMLTSRQVYHISRNPLGLPRWEERDHYEPTRPPEGSWELGNNTRLNRSTV